jgi:hypothetical protein
VATYFEASAVALGRFNPAIFQPEWFRANEVLPEAEIEAAESGTAGKTFVTNDVTSVSFNSLRVDVQQERWSITTTRPDWKKDIGVIAGSIFRLLLHTPIHTVGFNYNIHRQLVGGESAAKRALGRWVPVEPLAKAVGTPIHIGGAVRSDWNGYRVTFILDSSVRLKGGVYVGQNYERKDVHGAGEFGKLLETDWPKVMARSEELIAKVLEGEEAS